MKQDFPVTPVRNSLDRNHSVWTFQPNQVYRLINLIREHEFHVMVSISGTMADHCGNFINVDYDYFIVDLQTLSKYKAPVVMVKIQRIYKRILVLRVDQKLSTTRCFTCGQPVTVGVTCQHDDSKRLNTPSGSFERPKDGFLTLDYLRSITINWMAKKRDKTPIIEWIYSKKKADGSTVTTLTMLPPELFKEYETFILNLK